GPQPQASNDVEERAAIYARIVATARLRLLTFADELSLWVMGRHGRRCGAAAGHRLHDGHARHRRHVRELAPFTGVERRFDQAPARETVAQRGAEDANAVHAASPKID